MLCGRGAPASLASGSLEGGLGSQRDLSAVREAARNVRTPLRVAYTSSPQGWDWSRYRGRSAIQSQRRGTAAARRVPSNEDSWRRNSISTAMREVAPEAEGSSTGCRGTSRAAVLTGWLSDGRRKGNSCCSMQELNLDADAGRKGAGVDK